MTLGSMNHLGITVSDLAGATERFYGPLLGFLGYRLVEDQPEMSLWLAPGGWSINLWQAREGLAGRRPERYAPGFHHFAFNAGPFVRIEGTAKGGTVDRITFLGDPSGTVADDRKVLTALGLTIAMAEPELLPSGRKELLAALGLDIEEPDLAGLDGSLNYRDHRYTLRWDPEIARIVFTVGPIPES